MQINAQEAVHVCSNPVCPYPVGSNCETVYKPVKELLLSKPHAKFKVEETKHNDRQAVDNKQQQATSIDTELDELLSNFIDQQS